MLHHFPICVNYALFEGKTPIADPTVLEERVTNASLILAVNSYKELCSIHLSGVSLTSPHLIQKCSEKAADRARHIVEYIKSTLEQDRIDRENGDVKGFSQSIMLTKIISNSCDSQNIDQVVDNSGSDEEEMIQESCQPEKFEKVDGNTVASSWAKDDSSENSSSDVELMEVTPSEIIETKNLKKPEIVEVDSSDDEEKETIVLN